MTDFDTVLVEKGDGYGIITLNRPQALNALNTQTLDDLLRMPGEAAAEFASLGYAGPVPEQGTAIVLDLNLPDMSGTDILERVKGDERLRRAPVVVLTTTDDKVEIQRCYDLGCNVYITKPVDYDQFATAIRQLGLFLSVMQVPEPNA